MRTLFVTGGAGFLGTALLKRLKKKARETSVTVYSTDESKHEKLRRRFPETRFILGDVRDFHSLKLAMAGHDTVIHAAAMKYVPEGEVNVRECVAVNLDGSRNVAQAAFENGVERVVGISTDKACGPVNVYGATKWMMERLFQEYALRTETIYTLARYGNVVGSTGSVIPLFRRLAREERRIQLTNPQMTRFWLSVETAVALIEEALEAKTGSIIIPKLPAIRLQDLALAAIKVELPFDWANVKIDTIGQRFGEKVNESLVSDVEAAYTVEWNDRLLMRPVPEGIQESHIAGGYSSDKPVRFLTSDEMRNMIEEVEA